MKEILEILESREGILVKHIEEDRKLYGDSVLREFYRGRVAIEENWLNETRKLIEFIKRHEL